MICKRCQKRGQDWNGSAPVCAFDGRLADNWNCATINAIRDICYEGVERDGVDYRYCEDQKYATIKIDECEDKDGCRIGLALWVSWYKNRGATDALWILSDFSPPREPTEDELEIIIRYYGGDAAQARALAAIAARPQPSHGAKILRWASRPAAPSP